MGNDVIKIGHEFEGASEPEKLFHEQFSSFVSNISGQRVQGGQNPIMLFYDPDDEGLLRNIDYAPDGRCRGFDDAFITYDSQTLTVTADFVRTPCIQGRVQKTPITRERIFTGAIQPDGSVTAETMAALFSAFDKKAAPYDHCIEGVVIKVPESKSLT